MLAELKYLSSADELQLETLMSQSVYPVVRRTIGEAALYPITNWTPLTSSLCNNVGPVLTIRVKGKKKCPLSLDYFGLAMDESDVKNFDEV